MASLTALEIHQLRVAKLEWFEYDIYSFGMTLSDGTQAKCEGTNKFNKYYFVPEDAHISKVVVVFNAQDGEFTIAQMIFYDQDQVLVKMGKDTSATGRREVFEI